MARSIKRNAVLKIAPKRKTQAKRQASRKVRMEEELASGGAYKRCFCSWNICDYRTRMQKKAINKRIKWERVYLCK